jgi:hypothetical protein
VTDHEFWEMIESARANEQADDAGNAIAAALVDRLTATSPESVLDFHDCYNRTSGALYRWDIWAAAYLIGRGCSDDAFSDFRAGIVGLGSEWYERVMAHPDQLAEHPLVRRAAADDDDYGLFAESIGNAAYNAYQRLTGDDHAFYAAVEGRGQPVGDDMGEEFDFDDPDEMRRRLPRGAA